MFRTPELFSTPPIPVESLDFWEEKLLADAVSDKKRYRQQALEIIEKPSANSDDAIKVRLSAPLPQPERLAIWREVAPVAQNLLHQAQEKLERLTKPRFRRWDSKSYRDGYIPEPNLRSFFDEYVAYFPIKTYEYGLNGIPDLTRPETRTISQICQNHKTELAAAGLETERADLEIYVAQTLECWLQDPQTQIGDKLLTTSPRGELTEQYPGPQRSNYVFINVFEKVPLTVSATGFRLTQFMSFDVNQDLVKLQHTFQTQLQAREYQPLPLPFQPGKRLAHHLISHVFSFSPNVSVEALRVLIHDEERVQTWPKKLSDFPAVDMTKYVTCRQAITEFCQNQFQELNQLFPPEVAGLYFDWMMDGDALFKDGSIRAHFIKWVEANAVNYAQAKSCEFIDMTADKLVDSIKETLSLKLAERTDQLLTPTQTQRLKALTVATRLDPSLPLGRIASMAHCISGTPGSLAAKGLEGLKLSQLAKLNPTMTLRDLSPEAQRLLKQRIESMTKIYVTNRATGEIEIYYLTIPNPEHAPLYEHSCYKETDEGPIIGPCGVDLVEDELVDFAGIMTETEYFEWQKALFAQTLTDALITDETQTPEEKQHIHALIDKLTQKLFRTSLGNLIAGVTEYQTDSLIALPEKYLQQIVMSLNPLKTLESLVDELDTEEEAEEELNELEVVSHAIIYADFNNPEFQQLQVAA